MDPRIKKAIKKAENKKKQEQEAIWQKNAAEEKMRKRQIESSVPKARLWVKEVLFDLIGEAQANGSKRVYLSVGSGYKEYIPAEALSIAAGEIDGLKVEWEWNEGSTDWEYPIEPHREYYVTWDRTLI